MVETRTGTLRAYADKLAYCFSSKSSTTARGRIEAAVIKGDARPLFTPEPRRRLIRSLLLPMGHSRAQIVLPGRGRT